MTIRYFAGRSSSQCEKDIRDTLGTHNAEQIAAMDREYKSAYGQSLSEAIAIDAHLSQATTYNAA